MSNLSNYTDDELFDLYASNIGDELRSRGYEYGWYKKTVYVGEIYVLVNRAFPKLVKIGYSIDAQQRAKQLSSSTAVPSPFHVYATYRVKKALVDKRLHELIDMLNPELHYANNREFFKLSPESAYGILRAIAEIVGEEEQLSLNPYGDEYVNELLGQGSPGNVPKQESTSEAEHGVASKRKSQPPFRFDEFGIEVGSRLFFYDKRVDAIRDDIAAIVAGPRTIMFRGKETSMSAVAKELLQLRNSPRGTEWWAYDETPLVEIYQRKYPKPKPKLRKTKGKS